MSHTDFDLLRALRMRARERRGSAPPAKKPLSFGERAADAVAATMGSWRFIVIQSVLLLSWVTWNATSGERFDPYPFILLNLALSFQAAYAAPIIMMSQNRQSDIDRHRAIEDFEVNQKAELEIETLHQKIDLLKASAVAEARRRGTRTPALARRAKCRSRR
jgi:uncharacterized membrane protein